MNKLDLNTHKYLGEDIDYELGEVKLSVLNKKYQLKKQMSSDQKINWFEKTEFK